MNSTHARRKEPRTRQVSWEGPRPTVGGHGGRRAGQREPQGNGSGSDSQRDDPSGVCSERPTCPEEGRPCHTQWARETSCEAQKQLSVAEGCKCPHPETAKSVAWSHEARSDAQVSYPRSWEPAQSVPSRPPRTNCAWKTEETPPSGEEEGRCLSRAAGLATSVPSLARPPELPSKSSHHP